mgnify:CR=1 FL=1
MIGRIQGTLISITAPKLLIDCNGVGYEVDVPMSTLYQLPLVGQQLTLLTHFHVREDQQQLFGFATNAERDAFRSLIKISGVGARTALAVLSGMSVNELVQAITIQEPGTLTRVPGIGKKTAERLMIELRDRFKAMSSGTAPSNSTVEQIQFTGNSAVAEAEAALQSLGYKPLEAQKLVNAAKGDFTEASDIIRAALKSMNK